MFLSSNAKVWLAVAPVLVKACDEKTGVRGRGGLGRPSATGYRRASLEDGPNFASHAAGPSRHIPERDCRGLVVVGHADHTGACADRPCREVGVRFLRTIPGSTKPS